MTQAGLTRACQPVSRIRAACVRAPALQAGFTLLEIMVVVLIIGVMAAFAVGSIGGRTLDDGLETEARRLRELLVLAADEAVLHGTEVGFVHTADGYRFLSPDSAATPAGEAPRWIPVADDPTLRPRRLPEPFYLELEVEGRAVAPVPDDGTEPAAPQVLLSSSGEVTPFLMRVRARHHQPHYRLESNLIGAMKLEREESP